MIFSCSEKTRDRWLLVLVQQLEAVGAEVFLSWLQEWWLQLSFQLIRIPARWRAKRCMSAGPFKYFSRRLPNGLYFIDQNYIMWLLSSVRNARKYVFSGNIRLPSNMWTLLISEKRMDFGLEASNMRSNYITRAENVVNW